MKLKTILLSLLCAGSLCAQTTTVTRNNSTLVTKPAVGTLTLEGATNFKLTRGTGTPEGTVTASPGSVYLDLSGALYIKTTGTGNTGWSLASVGSGVSDTAFGASWDAVTTIAPSKNAIYDWAHVFDTDDDGKVNVADLSTAGAVTVDSSGILDSVAPGANGNVLTSNGTIWTSAAPPGTGGTTSKVSGSDFATTSTTLVDITGLTYAAATNTKYEIDAMLIVQSTTTAGLQVAINYSAAGASTSYWLSGGTSSPTTNTNDINAFDSVSSGFATESSVTKVLLIRGLVVTTTNAGNIKLRIKKVTSGTATVYIGSRMTITPL